MNIFHWDETLESGNAEIDNQHRSLFQVANSLHEAILAGKGGESTSQMTKSVQVSTVRHFRDEEALMREMGYPGFEAHRQEHGRFEEILEQMASDGASLTAFQVLTVFNSMIRGHILEADLPMIRWVRSRSDRNSLDAIRPLALNPGTDH